MKNKKIDEWLEYQRNKKITYNNSSYTVKEIIEQLKEQVIYDEKVYVDMYDENYNEIKNIVNEIQKEKIKPEKLEIYQNEILMKKMSDYFFEILLKKKEYFSKSELWQEISPDVQSDFLQKVCEEQSIEKFYIFRIRLEEKYGRYNSKNLIGPVMFKNENVYNFLIMLENTLFCHCLNSWETIIKNKIDAEEKNFFGIKRYLLGRKTNEDWHKLNREKLQSKIFMKLSKYYDTKELKETLNSIMWIYYEFVKAYIYKNEEIWKWYYANIRLIKEKYKEDKFLEKLEKKGITEGNHLYFPNNKSQNIFEYNFEISKIYKYLSKIQNDILYDKHIEYLKQELYFLQARGNDDVIVQMQNIFSTDKGVFKETIYCSMLKEVLFVLDKNIPLPRDKRWKIKTCNDGYIIQDIKGYDIDKIWGIEDNEIINFEKLIKENINPALYLKVNSDTALKNLFEKGTCKNKQFGFLIESIQYLERNLSIYDQYVIELQTGIYSAWKLYESTYMLMQCDNDHLKKEVEELAAIIGKAHNLETRCWILEEISRMMVLIFNDSNRNIQTELKCLKQCLKNYIKEFNDSYDILFAIILSLYKEKYDGELEPMKNYSEMYFSKLRNSVIQLVNYKADETISTINPIRKYIFEDLRYGDAKTKGYKWFQDIWKHMNQGLSWLETSH